MRALGRVLALVVEAFVFTVLSFWLHVLLIVITLAELLLRGVAFLGGFELPELDGYVDDDEDEGDDEDDDDDDGGEEVYA